MCFQCVISNMVCTFALLNRKGCMLGSGKRAALLHQIQGSFSPVAYQGPLASYCQEVFKPALMEAAVSCHNLFLLHISLHHVLFRRLKRRTKQTNPKKHQLLQPFLIMGVWGSSFWSSFLRWIQSWFQFLKCIQTLFYKKSMEEWLFNFLCLY